jgi:hypothetical protein
MLRGAPSPGRVDARGGRRWFDVRVIARTPARRAAPVLAALVAALVLGGCAAGGAPDDDASAPASDGGASDAGGSDATGSGTTDAGTSGSGATDSDAVTVGDVLAGCDLVTADDLNTVYGTAFAPGTPTPSSLDAGENCEFVDGDATAIVQVSEQADVYFPADVYSTAVEQYADGAEPVGADRGLLLNGNVLLVKGQRGVFVTIIDFGAAYSLEQDQQLADRLLPRF